MSEGEVERRKQLTFKQAEGLEPLPQLLSGPRLTARFRAQAFDIIRHACDYDGGGYGGVLPSSAVRRLWTEHFGFYSDELPYHESDFHKRLKALLAGDAEFLDALQYLARARLLNQDNYLLIGALLRKELIGYRFIGKAGDGSATLMPIADEAEAAQNVANYSALGAEGAAQVHFRLAVERLKAGDFRGSVTESIHGVESVAKGVTGNPHATLGEALNVLSKSKPLNPALHRGLSAIYGWSSQDDGIRHAMSDEAQPVTEPEARFMISACLAFSVWLKLAGSGVT